MTKREREAHAYLTRLLKSYAPQCEPLPDLLGLCSQIDNLLVGMRDQLRATLTVPVWLGRE